MEILSRDWYPSLQAVLCGSKDWLLAIPLSVAKAGPGDSFGQESFYPTAKHIFVSPL